MGRASWAGLEKRLILRNGKAEYKRGARSEDGRKKRGMRAKPRAADFIYYKIKQ